MKIRAIVTGVAGMVDEGVYTLSSARMMLNFFSTIYRVCFLH